jgi:hypothetical protein
MKVVRIRMFTAVFFADMTPRKPRSGCDDPPSRGLSETVAMIDRGVAQTMKQSTIASSRYLMTFWNGCAPRPGPSRAKVVVRGQEQVADQDGPG